jgi:cytochrome c5
MAQKLLLHSTLAMTAILLPLLAAGQAQSSSSPSQTPPQTNPKQQTAAAKAQHPEDEGQRIFEQNCARCHASPDGFSPRISGTVVRHMRVRASLSQHDEEELLRFFNP